MHYPVKANGTLLHEAGAGPSKLTLCFLPFTAGEEPQSEGSIIKLIAPKGETTHYILRVASA
ncbi:hypothetical protein, partial [Dialister succinatiphilus]|uniref:hypothetical protein n=1 Tax=Dialister succinatiphilus TaxID=487173 RepID=UPI003AB31B6D